MMISSFKGRLFPDNYHIQDNQDLQYVCCNILHYVETNQSKFSNPQGGFDTAHGKGSETASETHRRCRGYGVF